MESQSAGQSEIRDLRADIFDSADDFVAENKREFRLREFAVEDVEIGPQTAQAAMRTSN